MSIGIRRSLFFILSFSVFVSIQAKSDSPNVLIIYADDMGFGDLGVQNADSKIPTPHLDQLASEGMRFTDGHSSSGICTPSRYALLTGRYHWRDFHDIVHSFGDSVFKPETLTLPEMLQEQGYATACIGKWHLGWGWDALRKSESEAVGLDVRGRRENLNFSDYDWSKSIPNGPLAHGFDHYFGDSVINFPPYAWIEDDKMLQIPNTQLDTSLWKSLKEGNWECRPGPMVTGWDPYDVLPELTRRTISYIESRESSDEPFFLYMPLPAPHAPIVPIDEFEGRSQAGPYGDFVVQVDWSCGQVLQALERTGLAEDTIVIFTADNGSEHYAYPRALNYEHWSSEPFRGIKRDIYEGGHHVPFVVRWPGVIEEGSVSNALVSQTDIMATLGAVSGCDIPEGEAIDSSSMLDVWKGELNTARSSMVHNTFEHSYAIREGDWVLIAAPSGDHNKKGRSDEFEKRRGYKASEGLPVELYNLRDDISQQVDLAKDNPEKVESMLSLLQRIRSKE